MIDMAGLAQKGGAVFSHVRIARTPEEIHAIRVSAGKADLVLGCDLVVSGAKKVLAAVRAEPHDLRRQHGRDHARRFRPLGRFFAAGGAAEEGDPRGGRRGARAFLRRDRHRRRRCSAIRSAPTCSCWASPSSMAACRSRAEAVEKAIELNGEAVAMNVAAFRWGRRAAHEPDFVRRLIAGAAARRARADRADARRDHRASRRIPDRLSETPAMRRRYCDRVAAIREAEAKAAPGSTAVTEAVARNLFKLMAIKDEYEVARLYTDGSFKRQLDAAVPKL